ncbi:hypothetical protein DFH07DRAFT_875712 [Mycena maculata]|uniref:Uncharacterized protein n=1 Tax=Mycena maculata TaxID=230809 RepID=A0AAD7NYF9_9AGAR|nr:hypothetical protein DFH07DRAFT_875712 [Mycena maculata]
MAELESSYVVAFPTTDKNYQPQPRPRPPHLPFRRISLPSNYNPRRESVVSVASFDSLPEEGHSPSSPSMPAVIRNVANPGRKSKVRPMSSARRLLKPLDDPREAKRRKVIQEFYETEKAYVDGLEMIYSHFLTPIIASLDTPQPLLQRSDLASVFSNFVDIWNLHRAFFASLSDLLSIDADGESTTLLADPPPLSPVLLSHFPYLSLYNPFVTAFPSTISSMSNLASPPTASHPNPHYSPAFAEYLLAQEADPCCGKLKLRDWLLTIVQRCPRYLLLLKDLIACTDPDDPEHAQLAAVHALVARITLTLNTSIHTHAQTLSLLALQRATPSLPFQLIVPGRALVRRGPLSHVERSAPPRDREFLLFSDCLVWLEAEDGWASTPEPPSPARPSMVRTRSKSEAELPVRSAAGEIAGAAGIEGTRSALPPPKSAYHHPVSRMKRRHASGGGGEDGRWVYKGRAALVDLEVVVVAPPREAGEERRFEVLSPEGSFVLYADSEAERDAWTAAVRTTKAQLFVSLGATHPDSTLTSSSSTAHLRRSLQALPFPPSDERLSTLREGKGAKGSAKARERRGRVEHWVPAIWIPDEKTEGCMRCGRPFGWRRRRHHCRLCGRCVCAGCSERTFFIADPSANAVASKPARACNACYETVFPLLPPEDDDSDGALDNIATNNNTMTALANFPSWLSMPSLPLPGAVAGAGMGPEALMAIDRERGAGRLRSEQGQKYERLRHGPAAASASDFLLGQHGHAHAHAGEGSVVEMAGARVRVRSPPPRPRSYHTLLEDFEEARFAITSPVREDAEEDGSDTGGYFGGGAVVDLGEEREGEGGRRNEDTARRNKRFSLPAVAVQITSVEARTEGREGAKRFSLVLGSRSAHAHVGKGAGEEEGGLGRGVAAGKLSELLGRHKGQGQQGA